mgnify:FL=1
MDILHPAQWELSFASRPGGNGRCAFSDRMYERMNVPWREVKYPPNLQKLVEVYQARKHPDSALHEVPHAPEPWEALARKTPEGWIVHAGRFFVKRRWLVEVTLVWTAKRDKELETAVWNGLSAQDPEAESFRWQAMGLSAEMPADWDLVRYASQVGRVHWEFEPLIRPGGRVLCLDRYAMPDVLIQNHPRQWLADQLPPHTRILRSIQGKMGPHITEELVSSGRLTLASSMIGRVRMRKDLQWRCPQEDRLYHASISRPTRSMEVDYPRGFTVRCCQGRSTPAEQEARP